MGDDDNRVTGPKSNKPGDSDAPGGRKIGGERELGKKEGPKGEKAWGNRQPEPKDPTAPPKGPNQELSVGPVYSFNTKSERHFAFSTKTNDQDKTFVEGLRVTTSDVEVLSASVKLNEGKAKAVLVKASAEASVVHGEVDLVAVVTAWLFGKPKPAPPPPPAQTFAPMAVRLGDLTTHGSPLLPGPGSPNVMIGGAPAWRIGLDLDLCPFPGAAPHGAGPTALGESTVLINGAPAARVGDYVLEPGGGPNVILTGCSTVMIGAPAGPPPEPASVQPKAEDPWVSFDATASGDLVEGDAKADASVEWDSKKAKGKVDAEVGASAAVFKGKIPLKVKLRIPWTAYHATLGLTAEGSVLSVGAEAGGRVAINDGDKPFSGRWGAKVGAGLAGVGLKFGVDISK